MAKYRCNSTEPRNDGSGMISWDIEALSDSDAVIPGRHVTILTPADETRVALAGTGVGNKLIALLLKYKPEDGWESDELDLLAAANDLASEVDGELDTFIGTAGGYPISFSA